MTLAPATRSDAAPSPHADALDALARIMNVPLGADLAQRPRRCQLADRHGASRLVPRESLRGAPRPPAGGWVPLIAEAAVRPTCDVSKDDVSRLA